MNPYYTPYSYGNNNLSDAEITARLTNMMLIIIFMAVITFLAVYILKAIAFYRMAKRRGYSRPYLAWIPFAQDYLFGKIVDDIQEHKGIKSKHRIFAMLSEICTLIVSILSIVSLFWIYSTMFDIIIHPGNSANNPDVFYNEMAVAIVVLILLLLVGILSIGISVYIYVLLYKLFDDYDPKNKVLYIVLSILVSFAYPIILLVISGKQPQSLLPYQTQRPPYPPNGYDQQPYGYSQPRFWK